MDNFIFKKFVILFLAGILGIAAIAGLGATASAYSLFGPQCNTPDAAKSSVCTTDWGKGNNSADKNIVIHDIKTATNIVAFLGGAAAVIMIVIAGLSLVTSGGNSEKVSSGQRRILNASIGLAIIALAWQIARFITDHIL